MQHLWLLLALGLATCVNGAASRSPVEAVVKLLEDLRGRVQQESKAEQQTYDKYACWCEKTTSRKAAAIDAAQQELRVLGQAILKFKGQIATLESEITALKQNMEANQALQDEATSLRQKQNAAYIAQTSEVKQTIAALERAISVLVSATGPALLQRERTARAAINGLLVALPSSAVVKPEDVSLLGELGSGKLAYAPQSATVQGILKDMYDTFSGDLEAATASEAVANRHYEVLIHTKTQEMLVLQASKARKEGEKSEAELLLAQTAQSYDDTEAQRRADIAFFDDTKAACESKHSQWVARKALRDEELAGISKALEILSSDEARETFAAADKPGIALLQVGSADAAVAQPVAHAYEALKAQASAAHSLRLAALAARVRDAKVGHFDEVIHAIDGLISTLQAEDLADIAKRDQCKEEYQKVASTVAQVTWLIEKNEAKIHKLEDMIAMQNKERDDTIAEIIDTEEQIAALEAQRKAENEAYLKAKSDDEHAIDLLTRATDAFAAYYQNHGVDLGVGLVQRKHRKQPEFEISADQAPEAHFADHDEHKHESKGIVSFLTMIIEDLRKEIDSATKAEEAAQLAFEKQHSALTELKQELLVKKTNLEESIAKREEEKSDEHATMRSNQADLKDEQDYHARIKPDCDWIIGAFQERAARRTAELNGLTGAKEYLVGASPSLLEKSKRFDDTALPQLRFLGLRA